MKTRALVCSLVSCACLVACTEDSADSSEPAAMEQPIDSSESATTEDPAANSTLRDPLTGLTPEQQSFFDAVMARENRGFIIPPPDSERLEGQPDYSGQWIERGGVKECDGYLTSMEDEAFCSSEIPRDWVPFEFEGRTYYVEPLSGDGS